MIGPSSHISKLLLTLFFLLLLFYVFMDVSMYLRIQNYPISLEKKLKSNGIQTSDDNLGDLKNWTSYINNTKREFSNDDSVSFHPVFATYDAKFGIDSPEYESVTWINCDINPLCYPTVKGLMLDHTNHYLFAPLVSILDMVVGISEKMPYITPNMISYSHVFLAMIAGKLVSIDCLAYRRLGVILFQLRTFMDDLDGHVARARKHIKGERSEVGTAGYYIDGVCDLLGLIFLIIGIFCFLKNNPPRRGYVKVHTILPQFNEPAPVKDPGSDSNGEVGFVYKSKVSMEKVVRKILMFSGQLMFSSMAWNRYIDIYQDTLENEDSSPAQQQRQLTVFRSGLFFTVAWLWKIVNVHSFLHCILFAIFCDKLWDFLRLIQYSGYILLITCVVFTEMHIVRIQNFVYCRY